LVVGGKQTKGEEKQGLGREKNDGAGFTKFQGLTTVKTQADE